MITPIGEMREQVVILTPVRTVDQSGGEVITYTSSDPLFVAIRSVSTREAVQFGQISSEVSHICFGHWQSLKDIKATHRLRIVESDQEFDVAGDAINDPKRAWTRLHLVVRSNG